MTGETRAAPAGPGLAPTPTAEPVAHDPVEPQLEASPPPRRDRVEHLVEAILEETGPPIDVWAIAGLLENMGIRDRDAADRYGRRDVFGLAYAVQVRLPPGPAARPSEPPPAAPVKQRLGRYARIYGRGTFFFVPLALQLIALLTLGVSQFASLDFTLRQASLVAAAAALSFLVIAGFTQALGYLAPIYSESGKHMLAETISWSILGAGAAAAVAVGGALWGAAAITESYPPEDLRIAAVYYALLAAQGLASALLYMLRKFAVMVAATVVSLGVAGLLYRGTSLPIEHVHWTALAAGVAIQLAVGVATMQRRARNTRGDLRLARLPRVRLLVVRALPFGVYGLFYFTFLTTDRAVAWADGEHPLPFWFQVSYELGLDWALAGVVFALAFLEVTVEDFSRMLVPTGERFKVGAVREHNREVTGFWARQLAYVAAVAAAGAWLAVVGAVALHELGALGRAEEIYDDPVTRYVFAVGLLGYALMALGIANSVFVMSLSRPWRAVTSVAPAVVVSVAVGIAATSHYAHWTAVFGLLAGAAVFAAVSSWQAWRTLRRADYFSYAAY